MSLYEQATLRLLEQATIQVTEELLLDTVSLVTTYYANASAVLWDRRMQLLAALLKSTL